MSATLHHHLDTAFEKLQHNRVRDAFTHLGPGLNDVLDDCADETALQHLGTAAKQHPLFRHVLEDPYSHRAYTKPRGYAGDAVMLDYVYRLQPPQFQTEMGQRIFAGTALGPMGLSVNYRKTLLAATIQNELLRKPSAQILSVAAGHCRELLETDFAVSERPHAEGARIYALDQDTESCREIERALGEGKVRVINQSIRYLLDAKLTASLPRFDLIYSAGLFDYLDERIGARLIAAMASLLAPGGKLLVGNYAKAAFGRGFMALMLDWKLTYRSLEELIALGEGNGLTLTNQFADPYGNVVYAQWSRET